MRGVVFVFFVLGSAVLNVFAQDCHSQLQRLEKLSLQQETNLVMGSQRATSPRFHEGPLHFSSDLSSPFIWLTHPHEGVEYFVVEKDSQGFGFSPPPVHSHRILPEGTEGMYLRSLDAIGLGGPIFLVSFVADVNGSPANFFRVAKMNNATTGRLELLPGNALVVENIQDVKNGFVVTAQPGTAKYWVTDGSKTFLNLEIDGSGQLHLIQRVQFPEIIPIRGQEKKLEGFRKLLFFDETSGGIIRMRTEAGEEYITLFGIIESASQPEQEVSSIKNTDEAVPVDHDQTQEADFDPDQGLLFESKDDAPVDEIDNGSSDVGFLVDFENARKIRPGALRMSLDGTKKVLYLTYPDEVVTYYVSSETGQIRLLKRMPTSEIAPGYDVIGVEIYRTGQDAIIETEDGPRQVKVNIQSQQAVIVENKETKEIRILWK